MRTKVIIILMILVSFTLVACNKKKEVLTPDEIKFKEEYEKLNGKKQDKNTIMEINITKDNNIKYIDSSEAIDILKNKTGVIYFGFPECPWCRNLVPVLVDAMQKSGIGNIYYANILDERDLKKLAEDKTIITEKEGSDNYKSILEILKDHLGVYEGLNDENIKRLYFPTVVFVKNGKISDVHIGTIDSQKDPYKKLTNKQTQKLENLLINYANKIQKLTCDTDKTC